MTNQRRLAPIGTTARLLGVTVQWLRDEAEAGRVPCLRAGSRLLFDPEAVEAVLAERARTERTVESEGVRCVRSREGTS